MNCQNCGGGLEPVGNRPYFRCPYCETFHFPQELEDGVAVLGGETRHECPVCEETLTHAAIEGHKVNYCQNCRGFLVKNETFGMLVRMRRAKHSSPAAQPLPFDRKELQRSVKCPSCKKLMDTHPYHAGGNAVIDTCFRCHTVWLDAGELTVLGRHPHRTAPHTGYTTQGTQPAKFAPEPQSEVIVNLFGFPIRFGL